uniref:Kinetochore-associated protein DSN1-like protein n=1 Tax=Callorhinchus milii TaxID=7868 RepID=A0A4W3GWA8_CALMI|eukprot:gi/632981627/ref/XP_007907697.1/ PREDICTED: kinetochore-associated protein DSN1 homolog isoform X1 [Callorhinchus milii]
MADGGNLKIRLRNSKMDTEDQDSIKKSRRTEQGPQESELDPKPDPTPPRRSLRKAQGVSPGLPTGSLEPPPGPSLAPRLSPKPPAKKSPRSSLLSWRRSSFKGRKSRKSLPPIHCDTTEIFKGISQDLPEDERLAQLLEACLRYCLQKLEQTSEPAEDPNSPTFQARAATLTSEFKRTVEAMKVDGTLKKCTERAEVPTNPETQMIMDQLKQDFTRLNNECKAWDQILTNWKEKQEQATKDLEQVKFCKVEAEPVLENSQTHVIESKPDYSHILGKDAGILQSLECIMDRLQLMIQLLNSARQEWEESLQSISASVASNAFQGLECSPVRKFFSITKK